MTTEEVKKAIDELAKKANTAEKADDALKFSQAALNLAHAAITLFNMK